MSPILYNSHIKTIENLIDILPPLNARDAKTV